MILYKYPLPKMGQTGYCRFLNITFAGPPIPASAGELFADAVDGRGFPHYEKEVRAPRTLQCREPSVSKVPLRKPRAAGRANFTVISKEYRHPTTCSRQYTPRRGP